MSVKSDRPIRPGGCSWRKMTSRLGPLRARQLPMRRSKVRRTPVAISGCRRQISSKIATARMPGAAASIGTRLRRPPPSVLLVGERGLGLYQVIEYNEAFDEVADFLYRHADLLRLRPSRQNRVVA